MTLLKPGSTIYDMTSTASDGKIILKYPGIALLRCGGGEGYFFWDGENFKEAMDSK